MIKPFEYVASGCGYLRLFHSNVTDEIRNEFITHIDNKLNGHNNHEFSMLYNSFSESGYGEKLQYFRPHLKHVHADSGGLQMVTTGAEITPELKKKVYVNQGKYADIGMCFDEIPLTVVGETSRRGDTSNRYFDHENFEEKARLTGLNVVDQIHAYEEMGSDCKPFVILQGNCFDTFYRWAEVILETIPLSYHDRIGGISVSGASLGNGTLETIKLAAITPFLPFDRKELKLHILGVGSVARLLPFVTFIRSGLYDNIKISYDSTTHSMGPDNGLYYSDFAMKRLGRELSQNYREAYEIINAVCPLDMTIEQFHKVMNRSMTNHVELGEDPATFMRVKTGVFISSVYNFMNDLSNITTDKNEYTSFLRRKNVENVFRTLQSVKSIPDFYAWEREVGKFVDSTPISKHSPLSLSGLFD